jgi:thymidylate kinase
MLIILEGADGTGKTTVATGLLDLTGAQMMHASQPKGNWVEEYVDPLLGYQPRQTTAAHRQIGDVLPEAGHNHLVCDRWHWGEVIYGPLYRGASILDEDAFVYMSHFLNSKGALIIHMWNTEDVIRKRWDERGEDFLQPEHLAQVLTKYHELAANSFVPVLNCRDVDHARLESIVRIARALEESATEMYGGAA